MRRSLALALCALALACGHKPPASAQNPKLGKPVQIALPTDAGDMASIPPGDRKKVLLHFFSPSCESCRKKLPALVDKRDEISARGARLVLVAVLGDHESIDQATAALREWGVPWTFLIDQSGASRSLLGVGRVPSSVLVDGKGKLLWYSPEDAAADEVVDAIR
ncbi:MAG: TlpA family protein disulfide reductase [Deltaproteobacteria bacterium]|nr:TlpA family protein disulfide reductase [Deltaproteobacteria bacterium]